MPRQTILERLFALYNTVSITRAVPISPLADFTSHGVSFFCRDLTAPAHAVLLSRIESMLSALPP
jgi:hypothetical protein